MNSLTPKSSKFNYIVEPFQEDFTGRLSWHMLGNRILAAASLHANSRGFGMEQLMPHGLAWVVSRLAIEMDEIPRANEEYTIETWIRRIYRTFTDRCFAILRPDGTPYGYAYTVWALVDINTRRPVNLEHLPGGGFAYIADPAKPCNVAPFAHIQVRETEPIRTLNVQYSDIDINNHVNSIRYIEHVLDLFPEDFYTSHEVHRIEVAYHEEAYAGDNLRFYRHEAAPGVYDVEIRKAVLNAAPGAKEPAVCACRVEFRQNKQAQ